MITASLLIVLVNSNSNPFVTALSIHDSREYHGQGDKEVYNLYHLAVLFLFCFDLGWNPFAVIRNNCIKSLIRWLPWRGIRALNRISSKLTLILI